MQLVKGCPSPKPKIVSSWATPVLVKMTPPFHGFVPFRPINGLVTMLVVVRGCGNDDSLFNETGATSFLALRRNVDDMVWDASIDRLPRKRSPDGQMMRHSQKGHVVILSAPNEWSQETDSVNGGD